MEREEGNPTNNYKVIIGDSFQFRVNLLLV